MEIKKEDILELIEKFENTDISKMTFTHEGTTLELEKQPAVNVQALQPALPKEDSTQAENESGQKEEGTGDGTPVKAPLAGIFYRAPSPDAEPFVKPGRSVKKGEVVGIIEAMKTMNEITAPASGKVSGKIMENGAFAQYGDVLMVISEENNV